MGAAMQLSVALLLLIQQVASQPGFLSLDCGGNSSYTDASTRIEWQPDQPFLATGGSNSAIHQVFNASGVEAPVRSLRSFAAGSDSKFCYTLPVNASQRYLVRATFLYGNYDGRNALPEFQLFLNVTLWADVKAQDSGRLVFEEMIVLSTGAQLDVCMVPGATGDPFMSTLELRQLFGSMYSVPYETRAYLKHSSRVNFGALTSSDVRYPDDPVDRIWQSDLIKPNNLAHEAPGTVRVSTNSSIRLELAEERPPEKVMQTAVVGSNGSLTYRYLIDDFPGFAFGKTYFAEVQALRPSDVRAFTFVLPNDTLFRGQVVNLVNDVGAFRAYEPGYDNVTLRQIINFAFQQASAANLGPILNAMEIMKIVNKQDPTSSSDFVALQEFIARFRLPGSGDPCKPVAWDWLSCSSDSSPRVTQISLSGRGLNGTIPSGISRMTSLIELDLSNNSLSGAIPDMNLLTSLRQVHLQNNRLSGDFPESLAAIGSLQELYVQNNFLTGSIPSELLSKRGLDFQYSGNPGLCISDCSKGSTPNIGAIVGGVVGGVAVVLAVVAALLFLLRYKKKAEVKPGKANKSDPYLNQDSFASMISTHQSQASDSGSIMTEDQAQRFTYQEVRDASNNFSSKIGSGGFGNVYYGKLKTGVEVAIKVLSPESHQGIREFSNEVTLLSRIHHRDLVQFLGFCLEGKERILVYEFMGCGSLRDHLYATTKGEESLNWMARIRIVLDAAKGVDYLHTGCSPSIIHRDIKSSNILINDKKAGKVSDFGLSKMTSGETSLVSTTVKGTVGYLDPEYYMNQRLTEKSDVYSFGIVLLETISAREPLNPELFQPESNIVQWARVALQKGNIKSIVDPALGDDYRLESMWKVAETAIFCVEPYGVNRPTMNEVVRELEEAYQLEHESSRAAAAASDDDDHDAAAAAPAYHLDAPLNPMALVFVEPDAR